MQKRIRVVLSGEQGDVMCLDEVLPMSMWVKLRELCAEAAEHRKVYEMTLAGHHNTAIAKATGRSVSWVTARQKEMGSVRRVIGVRGRKPTSCSGRLASHQTQ